MTEHKVGKLTITLRNTSGGVEASAMVQGSLGYRHKVMYQGYTQKQILKRFAIEVRQLNRATAI